jgi:hypothetical protein
MNIFLENFTDEVRDINISEQNTVLKKSYLEVDELNDESKNEIIKNLEDYFDINSNLDFDTFIEQNMADEAVFGALYIKLKFKKEFFLEEELQY